MNVFQELKARNLIAQCTDMERAEALLAGDTPVRFYIGFDPTADSLTVGHFIPMMVMAHMQKAGHIPIVLLGGGTVLVGDPSGKNDMRKMLTREEVSHNIGCFKRQMSALIDFSDDRALMVNNADWLLGLNYIDFLREIGVHFSVNRMLAAECYKSRLETGLSFFEMNYMVMQSYDFLHLNRALGCQMQLGGDDQWSNIIGGVELCRRCDGKEVYGLTFTLLLTSEGKKMGKTETGALWLDAEKTSPYEFYQYWRNINDSDVENCLALLTFLPMDEVRQLAALPGSEINEAKRVLAYEVTALIHGEAEAENARKAAEALFGGGGMQGSVPTTRVTRAELLEDGRVTALLAQVNLAKSRGAARKLIEQGGVHIGSDKITDTETRVTPEMIPEDELMLRVGKKGYHRLTLG